VPIAPDAIRVFETCWAVLTALSVVPPDAEPLLRPLTRWLIERGRAVASGTESIGRNPNAADRIQTPMIIGIAFMEALAIYALVIAFFLQGKI